jgi:hypothetical protein
MLRRIGAAVCASAVVPLAVYASDPAALPNRAASVLRSFELLPFSLTNFGYGQAELDAAAPFGLISFDRPGIGSGLVHLEGNRFMGITDRGPNLDHFPVDAGCTATSSSSNGKTFPLPQFTPAVVTFEAINGTLLPSSVVNLVDGSLAPITGITNDAADDAPFGDPCSNVPMPFNPNGMDVEDFAALPNGKFIGVEENKPSIFIGDLTTGIVEVRYTPSGKTLPGAGYAVSDSLPAILVNRRNNRGFEGVTVSPDGRTAYTATQSPLGSNASGSPYRNSRVLRILRLDVSDPYNLQVTGQFVVLMSDRSSYPASINQRDLKLSAMSWVGPDRLLLLERSDESARGGIRLLMADLSGATNIHGLAMADTLLPEDVTTNLAAQGISPAATSVVFQEMETDAVRRFWTYKLEGMAILNRNDIAIINDNDFGVVIPDAPTNLWVVRLGAQLPR